MTNVELKTGVYPYPGIEEKVWAMLQQYHLEDKVIISSFNHYSILHMKKIAPNVKYGLLTETWLVNPGAYTKALGVACYHPYYGSLTDDVIDELQAQGIEINTFTVNDEDAVKRLLAKKIDIVIGNFPDMVGRVLKGEA